MVYVTDIVNFVEERTTELDKVGLLHTRDMTLPADEVWVKIDGDHGGDLFKMTMQILHTSSPNSKSNTVVISSFQARDNIDNLKISMDKISSSLGALQIAIWNDKHIVLFLTGDYKFLCDTYGLQGAAATYPCLWCSVTKEEMQISEKAKAAPSRTIEDIKEDFTN